MLPEPEKYLISLEKAKKLLMTADHLTYVTFPLLKESKLLLKILEEINLALLNTINAILQYEYSIKQIQLYSNSLANFNTFKNLTIKYHISIEQLAKVKEILELSQKHKKSPFEFVKNNKIVIMSDGNLADTLTLDKIKVYILEVKDIIRKASLTIKSQEKI